MYFGRRCAEPKRNNENSEKAHAAPKFYNDFKYPPPPPPIVPRIVVMQPCNRPHRSIVVHLQVPHDFELLLELLLHPHNLRKIRLGLMPIHPPPPICKTPPPTIPMTHFELHLLKMVMLQLPQLQLQLLLLHHQLPQQLLHGHLVARRRTTAIAHLRCC